MFIHFLSDAAFLTSTLLVNSLNIRSGNLGATILLDNTIMELRELLSNQLLVFGKHHRLIEFIVALSRLCLLDRLLDQVIRSHFLPCRVNHDSLGGINLKIFLFIERLFILRNVWSKLVFLLMTLNFEFC